jgi:uncharacterized membrane protein
MTKAATASTGDDQLRLHDLHAHEDDFRRKHPLLWGITLYGPFVLTVVLFGLLVAKVGLSFAWQISYSALLALWFFGRFMILNGSHGSFWEIGEKLSSEQLFSLLFYMDVMVALVLAFHIGFLFKLPVVGPRVEALVTDGRFILDSQPWIKRMTFIGLVLVVIFPLAATGSVGGSIFGRLLGMSRVSTFVGILLGSLIGNGLMYYFSEWLGTHLDKEHPLIKYGGFVLLAGVIFLLERRYQKLRREFAQKN